MALATTSLKRRKSDLDDTTFQLNVLNAATLSMVEFPKFSELIERHGKPPIKPKSLEILQLNIGKMCNQACKHCHVDAGPDRKEMMDRETMMHCLNVIEKTQVQVVDITGGAPEMHPDFRWFANEIHARNTKMLVRCNLTIIVANKKYNDLPQFYADRGIHVVSSLPFYDSKNVDRQRGDGVFEESIAALKMLNAVGYGMSGTGLILDLVYNPVGALLPGPQAALEAEFKRALSKKFEIEFNALHCITNMPISRFLDFLIESGNYERYMQKLIDAFNPAAVSGVMCTNTLSVSYDGKLYDCDFNQMLELPVASKLKHISEFDESVLHNRTVVVNQHCYGCTAGAGSSCGGQIA
ncbi:MAG: arsenosugar biosynthesis radical SAM protein ArsS [Ignavibacteria bacterium]|nr:arsenosugar biosynthesis radical SAM protein ArsS [Ignavibacteria bacterium]